MGSNIGMYSLQMPTSLHIGCYWYIDSEPQLKFYAIVVVRIITQYESCRKERETMLVLDGKVKGDSFRCRIFSDVMFKIFDILGLIS